MTAALEGRCNGFLAGSTQPDSMGYLFAFFSVFFFGTNFIPVKQYKTGDGMFFQFVMCTGIWTVGLIVNLVREQPEFQPFAMLGGVLWATGNVMCVPIIKTIGLGMGMLIWGTANCCIGWATGAFGLFGFLKTALRAPHVRIKHSPALVHPPIAQSIMVATCWICRGACGACRVVQVKSDGSKKQNRPAAASSDDDDAESWKQQPLLSDGATGDAQEDAAENFGSIICRRNRRGQSASPWRLLWPFFGTCFNPPTYIMKHSYKDSITKTRVCGTRLRLVSVLRHLHCVHFLAASVSCV